MDHSNMAEALFVVMKTVEEDSMALWLKTNQDKLIYSELEQKAKTQYCQH